MKGQNVRVGIEFGICRWDHQQWSEMPEGSARQYAYAQATDLETGVSFPPAGISFDDALVLGWRGFWTLVADACRSFDFDMGNVPADLLALSEMPTTPASEPTTDPDDQPVTLDDIMAFLCYLDDRLDDFDARLDDIETAVERNGATVQ